MDKFKSDEVWIRTYHADIWAVGKILFQEDRTARSGKRLLRDPKRKWERDVSRLQGTAKAPARRLLGEWCKITTSYWPGLFHCYTDSSIPATNNEMERLIKDLKRQERALSRSPNPGLRFVRHAPINAVFVNRSTYPDATLLTKLGPERFLAAKAQIRRASVKTGILRRARSQYSTLLAEVLDQWRHSNRDASECSRMMQRGRRPT